MSTEALQKRNYLSWFVESGIGSVILAISAHGLIYAFVVFVLGVTIVSKVKMPEAVEDLQYQVFDEPPQPVKEEHKVVRSREPEEKVQPKAIPDTTPKEIQDEKGEVAGTQEAHKETTIGSTSNGTAEATPYYKIKPKYPRAAQIAGTEGWVLLQVDINEKGEVENIRVIGGEQKNTFESEARRAVAQWKYKPFLDASGKPVRHVDQQVLVNFKLNDEQESASL
jgi:TonB family protein